MDVPVLVTGAAQSETKQTPPESLQFAAHVETIPTLPLLVILWKMYETGACTLHHPVKRA
jgi:hypothetical protein